MFTKGLRVFSLLVFYHVAFVYCDDPILGPADLNIKQILQCENPEQYPSYFVVERIKVNRTHDIFNADVKLDVDLDETVGFYLNVAKWGDGGYKPNYFELNETNGCEALFRYARNDAILMLRAAGRPEKCPIEAGTAHLVDYGVDYRKVRKEALYGDFKILLLFVKDGVTKLCIEFYAESTPKKIDRYDNKKN